MVKSLAIGAERGFFYLIGHNISEESVARVYEYTLR